jgi:hypothetical protein
MSLAVQHIPTKISESLSPLTNSAEATQEAHARALKGLVAYEQALGITPKTSDTISARVVAVKAEAEQVVAQLLPAPVTEEQRSALSLQDLRLQAINLTTALEKATRLLAIANEEYPANVKSALPAPTPTGSYAELPDNREDFEPHSAYLFLVAPSTGSVMDELKELLGQEAAEQLAGSWGRNCDLNQRFEGVQVALFLNSDSKARSRDYAGTDDKTTQAEDFQATGHDFADDLAATLLCARTVSKLQQSVRLSDGERALYEKLRDEALSFRSGALCVDDGRLRAIEFHGREASYNYVLGSPL